MEMDVILPDLAAEPVRLSVWFADEGEPVFAGDRLVEVLLDGATFDVAAPATGRLLTKRALPNAELRAGQVLGVVQVEEDVG